MLTKISSTGFVNPDLTGNSCIALIGGVLYVVGSLDINGSFSVFKSTDNGKTFTAVATQALTAGTTEFDPAIAVDSSNNLHIVGSVANSTDHSKFDIVKYTFNTTSNILSGPVLLATNAREHAGYDIVVLSSGVRIIATTLWDATGYSGYNFIVYELSNTDIITNTTVLYSGDIDKANIYGSVSLISTDGTNVSMFYSTHANSLFTDKQINIREKARISAGSWGIENTLYTFNARFTDDRLTVVNNGNDLILTQAYYTIDSNSNVVSNILIGYYSSVAAFWSWGGIQAGFGYMYGEPVATVDSVGNVRIAALKFPINSNVGNLHVYSVTSTVLLTEITGNFNSATYTWLRGSKSISDTSSKWLLLGYSGSSAYYASNYNLPPVIVITPTSATLNRGVDLVLDASQSYDPDLDPITYTWSSNDVTGHFHFSSTNQNKTTVNVDKTIGPAATSITVTLQETDNINPPVSTTIPITIPAVTAPVVTIASPVQGTRNSSISITPTIIYNQPYTLTYTWVQNSGTTVTLHTSTTSPNLTVDLFRNDINGETLNFTLTVSDGINTPVVTGLQILVPAIDTTSLDIQTIKGTDYIGTINLRNTEGSWGTLSADTPNLNSDLIDFKLIKFNGLGSVASIDGDTGRIYLSQDSVLITNNDLRHGPPTYIKRRIKPFGEIVQAEEAENGYTYVLITDIVTSKEWVAVYSSDGPNAISDYPDQLLDISIITNLRYRNIKITPNYNQFRTIILYGDQGVLLLQVDSSNVQNIHQQVFLTVSNGFLYGSDTTNFIRLDNVTAPNTGKILIGTVDQQYNYYETLVDLSIHAIVGIWDKSKLISETITTGEFLFNYTPQYTGRPAAPVLASIVVAPDNNSFSLNWTEDNSTIVDTYSIYMKINSGTYSVVGIVYSGSILSTTIQYPGINTGSNQYSFYVSANNSDGSTTSNVQSVGTGVLDILWPQSVTIGTNLYRYDNTTLLYGKQAPAPSTQGSYFYKLDDGTYASTLIYSAIPPPEAAPSHPVMIQGTTPLSPIYVSYYKSGYKVDKLDSNGNFIAQLQFFGMTVMSSMLVDETNSVMYTAFSSAGSASIYNSNLLDDGVANLMYTYPTGNVVNPLMYDHNASNLYILNSSGTINSIDIINTVSNIVTTLVGGGVSAHTDGIGAAAHLINPVDMKLVPGSTTKYYVLDTDSIRIFDTTNNSLSTYLDFSGNHYTSMNTSSFIYSATAFAVNPDNTLFITDGFGSVYQFKGSLP